MNNNKTNSKSVKLIFIVLFLLIIITLSGCDNKNNGIRAARKITGTESIDINIDGNNKIELFGNYDMTEVYQITLENKGKYNIENNEIYAEISIRDGLILSDDNDGQKNKIISTSLTEFNDFNQIQLEGLSQIRTKGDSISKIVETKTNVPSGQGITSSIDVKACFKYETLFSESICINTVKNGLQSNCEKKEYTFSRGQGAPIKISKVIVSDMMVDGNLVAPRLIITIENDKKEIVTLPENFIGACTSEGDLNKIKLENIQLGIQQLNCNVENKIIDLSFKNKNTIICDLDSNVNTDQGSEFISVLHLELSYGYSVSKSLEIDITRE